MNLEATAIHTAYPEFLNSQLRTQIFQQGDNPFLSDIFHRIDSQQMRATVLDSKEPSIILATFRHDERRTGDRVLPGLGAGREERASVPAIRPKERSVTAFSAE